jgi:hypothetical protein
MPALVDVTEADIWSLHIYQLFSLWVQLLNVKNAFTNRLLVPKLRADWNKSVATITISLRSLISTNILNHLEEK